MKQRQPLPQNNLIISALARLPPMLVLGCFLLTYASIRFTNLFPPLQTPLNKSLQSIAWSPLNQAEHVKLANYYLDAGLLSLAAQELKLAATLTQNSWSNEGVLGDISSLSDTKIRLQKIPQEFQKKLEYWQKTTSLYPDFRDAWVELLYLYYNAGKLSEAKTVLEKIRALDVNFMTTLPEIFRTL